MVLERFFIFHQIYSKPTTPYSFTTNHYQNFRPCFLFCFEFKFNLNKSNIVFYLPQGNRGILHQRVVAWRGLVNSPVSLFLAEKEGFFMYFYHILYLLTLLVHLSFMILSPFFLSLATLS